MTITVIISQILSRGGRGQNTRCFDLLNLSLRLAIDFNFHAAGIALQFKLENLEVAKKRQL